MIVMRNSILFDALADGRDVFQQTLLSRVGPKNAPTVRQHSHLQFEYRLTLLELSIFKPFVARLRQENK